MKRMLVVAFVLISLDSFSQQFLLIDRKLKQPAQLADAVSDEQLNAGIFPIEYDKSDSLIQKLSQIRERLLRVGREKYDESITKIGRTTLTIKVIKWYYGDRFNVSLSTDTGNGNSPSFYIVDATRKNKVGANYIERLIKYIQKATK